MRVLNRLELLGETLHAALNAIATVDPDWLRAVAPPEWHERYDRRVEDTHLPRSATKREAYAIPIGTDGFALSGKSWAGYMIHVTETCDSEAPRLIVHAEATAANVHEAMRIEAIHIALAAGGVAPAEHRRLRDGFSSTSWRASRGWNAS